jgi:hypothetical protein
LPEKYTKADILLDIFKGWKISKSNENCEINTNGINFGLHEESEELN